MAPLGSVYLSTTTLNKLSIQDDEGHFELFKVCTQEATSMTNSGGILIGVFITSYDNLVAKRIAGDFLKYPLNLDGINEALANNILMDDPDVLVCSSDASELQNFIAFNVDHTGTLTFLGTMKDKKKTIDSHPTSDNSVTSDTILKRIAGNNPSGKRKPKTSLPMVFFGDKRLKPRAANDAAHAWINHHGQGYAKVDLVHQRGIASTGQNYMRRFQVYRHNKWVTIKTMQECLGIVIEHSGRDFYADMKNSPDSYGLSFRPSQFISNDVSVSVIDDEEEQRSNIAEAVSGSDSD